MVLGVEWLRLPEDGHSFVKLAGDEIAGAKPDPVSDPFGNGDLSLRGDAAGHGCLLQFFTGKE